MNYEVVAQYSEIIGGFAFPVVAVLLFRKFVLPAVRAGQIANNSELVTTEHRRDRMRDEVAAARGEVEAAERDALAIAARGETDARHEQEAIIAAARREGLRLMENARGELERRRIAGRDKLRIEFIEKALNRARELAAQELSDAANARLVSKTVNDLAIGTGA